MAAASISAHGSLLKRCIATAFFLLVRTYNQVRLQSYFLVYGYTLPPKSGSVCKLASFDFHKICFLSKSGPAWAGPGATPINVGAPLLGSKASYVYCSVPASSWETSFVGFRSCSGVALLFVCITAYKQSLVETIPSACRDCVDLAI